MDHLKLGDNTTQSVRVINAINNTMYEKAYAPVKSTMSSLRLNHEIANNLKIYIIVEGKADKTIAVADI